jgi:hypothetical protein
MASIKSFNLVGVGPQVQFGKGGLQIAQDSGAFAFRDATNTNLVSVEIAATPTAASHATSKQYVDGLINALTASQVAFDNTTANIPGAPTTVQAALNAVVTNGTAHIRDNNAAPKAQVATDEVSGAVTIDVSNGTTGKRIATFTGGAASDSSLNIHNEVAGAVSIDAYSATSSDVNVFINPQGNGRVYIGNGQADSALQADDGQSLTLAGGDSTTTNAGDIILRGGHTTASGMTDGNVKLEDSNGQLTLKIAGVTGADSNLTASNGVGQATVSVDSTAANADLVLAPKGTGAVNVSGAAIHNVQDPTNAQDAATKNYVDTQIATTNTAITTSKVGSLQNLTATISTATGNVGSAVTGRVRYVTVEILTPYSAGGTISIGTSQGPTALCDSWSIDESTAGLYTFQVDVNFTSATQIIATIGGTPAAGQARVMIDFIQG